MGKVPGYRGGGRWPILAGGGALVLVVAVSFVSCVTGAVHALNGTAAVTRPTQEPLRPESAYNPTPLVVSNDPSGIATPFPEPTRMTVSVASIARASSSVALPAPAATALRPVQQAYVARTSPPIRRVAVDMQFASRDQAQDAQARTDLGGVAPHAVGDDPEPSATMVGYVRPTQYELGEQDFISARLTVDVNSEHPGQVLAVVTTPVYDSATHTTLLIPAGTFLQGDDSTGGVSNGQSRLLVTWREMIFPNEVRFVMGSAEGADAKGAAGIPGDVNTHRGQAYGQAAIYTLLGAAGSLLGNIGNHSQVFLPSGGAGIGTLFAQQAQSLQPTISIPSESIVHVYATRPLALRPYAEIAAHD